MTVNAALDDANSPQVWNQKNINVATTAERSWLWAVTADGRTYNYDRVAADTDSNDNNIVLNPEYNNVGVKNISETYVQFQETMDAREQAFWNSP